MNIHSICGQRFGTLTAVRRADRGNQVRFVCKCDCGKEHNVSAYDLLNDRFHCGCGLEQAVVPPPETAVAPMRETATVKPRETRHRRRGK